MGNIVNYFELGTPDPERTRDFYGRLFGWRIGEPSNGYQMIDTDQGGIWDTTTMGGANWAIFYVQVDDVQGAVDKAAELGATVLLPLVDNGAIEFAHLADPHGNRFGVWCPKE